MTVTPTPPVAAPAPLPGAPPRRRGLAAVVAVVVVVAVVLTALYFAGLLPFAKPSSGAPNGPVTFSQARAVGDRSAAGFRSGGWSLIVAAGLDSPASATVPANATVLTQSFGLNCSLELVPGAPASVFLPSFRGNLSSGASPFWGLLYRNASNAVLVEAVVNGSASALATLPAGSTCTSLLGLLASVPSSVIDSPAAVAAANAAGGSAYLAAHPNATASLLLLGGFSFLGQTRGPTWVVTYSGCPPPGVAGPVTSEMFNATVDASSGRVLSHALLNATCPSTGTAASIPLPSALSFAGTTVSTSAGSYLYDASVASAGSGLRFDNLSLSVTTSTGGVITPLANWTVRFLAANGSVVASYALATGVWSSGGGLVVTSGMTLELVVSRSLTGDRLVVAGSGQFSGSVSLTLP